ncbi:hypothetical protein VdG1_08127 [Verticillium dahliae VDG1]|nr:hypothetical protein VdG1_08127 [Verticillium dahliae VDG1]
MSVVLPEPFASIPRESFLFGHSPIQPLPRISQALGGKVNRASVPGRPAAHPDAESRYLASEALAQGCDTLVSIGGVQSNHTRQVTAVATKLGLRAALVQEHWVDWEDPGYEKVGNLQLSRLMGADVEAQEKELGVFFDTVIVCAVTGSTMAGMVAGFKLAQKNGSPERKVIGIDASAKVQQTFDQVLRIAKATGVKIGLAEGDITEADIILDDRYHAGVYGIPDQTTIDAMKFGASTEGFITDPVYEGKSLAGMMDIIRKGELAEGSNVLYAHLGGQLALNAYSSL